MKETVKLQLAQTESVRKNSCMKSWWFEVKSAETLKISTNAKGKKRKTCLIASDWISANVSEAVCGGSCCCTERMCENISNKTTYVKQREGFPSSVCLCWFSQKAEQQRPPPPPSVLRMRGVQEHEAEQLESHWWLFRRGMVTLISWYLSLVLYLRSLQSWGREKTHRDANRCFP